MSDLQDLQFLLMKAGWTTPLKHSSLTLTLTLAAAAEPSALTAAALAAAAKSASALAAALTLTLRPIASVLYRDIYTVRAARLNLLLSHMQLTTRSVRTFYFSRLHGGRRRGRLTAQRVEGVGNSWPLTIATGPMATTCCCAAVQYHGTSASVHGRVASCTVLLVHYKNVKRGSDQCTAVIHIRTARLNFL